MVSRTKLFKQLDELESELKEKILPHLEAAANGNNDLIFCVQGFNSHKELNDKTDKTTEYLVNIGAQILSLKIKLEVDSEGSIAERICWYCNEWDNRENLHRNYTQDLAKQFLQEIKQQQPV